jgi:hypothetical protein
MTISFEPEREETLKTINKITGLILIANITAEKKNREKKTEKKPTK